MLTATSTASGHHVADLFDVTACPAEIAACSWTLMRGNGIRLPRIDHAYSTYSAGWHQATRRAGIAPCRRETRGSNYFLATLPLSITTLEGASGFMLSSAVMRTSKSLYVVAAFRLPCRSLFTRNAPSNSGSLPRGCTQ